MTLNIIAQGRAESSISLTTQSYSFYTGYASVKFLIMKLYLLIYIVKTPVS